VPPLIEGVAFGALLGDKAFDVDWIRADLDARGAAAVIPPKASRKGRFDFDRDMYRWRHLIENTFAKLKEFRAVATRYDKTDTSYAAAIHLAAAYVGSSEGQALVRSQGPTAVLARWLGLAGVPVAGDPKVRSSSWMRL
jgi:transposase